MAELRNAYDVQTVVDPESHPVAFWLGGFFIAVGLVAGILPGVLLAMMLSRRIRAHAAWRKARRA